MLRVSYRSFSVEKLKSFKLDSNYKLKCGLEVHTQLKSKYKLFSLTKADFHGKPNTNVSYFDAGLPGTQPKLNPEALFLALKAAVALNCEIQSKSTFDRKHYFYPDQPFGYQITQYYHPLALGGFLELNKFDSISPNKVINIEQIQIEQDTGRTTYDTFDNSINIDLNRSNTALIELVTKPDFETLEQVNAFVKKYQSLVRYLDVCTGDLETGAIRVDVNLSVNGNNKVEIKNLNSTAEIQDAMQYEYKRQVEILKEDKSIDQETRNWDGQKTVLLRKKEDAIDYRYFPDSELPAIVLDENIQRDIQEMLPELPDQLISTLTASPYDLELKHAKFLVDHKPNFEYYKELFSLVDKKANNFLFHELFGAFAKLKRDLDLNLITPSKLADLIKKIQDKSISLTSGRLILYQLIQEPELVNRSINDLINEYELSKPELSPEELDAEIKNICSSIIEEYPDLIKKIRAGNSKSIKFLVGVAMKSTQGTIDAKHFEQTFIEHI